MRQKVHRLAKIIASVGMMLAVLGLLFRATVYWNIPVSASDPYGLSDVIELFWFVALLVLAGITIMFSAVIAFVPQLKNARLAFILFLAAILSPTAYYLIHPFVPMIVG